MASPGDFYQLTTDQINKSNQDYWAAQLTEQPPPEPISPAEDEQDLGAMDYFAHFFSPFAVLSDAMLAPLSTGENTVPGVFKTSGLAAFDALFPGVRTAISEQGVNAFLLPGMTPDVDTRMDVGQSGRALGTHPDYGYRAAKKVNDEYDLDLSEDALRNLGMGLEVITDPSISLGIGSMRMLQKAPRAVQEATLAGETIWSAGVKDLLGTVDSSLMNVGGGRLAESGLTSPIGRIGKNTPEEGGGYTQSEGPSPEDLSAREMLSEGKLNKDEMSEDVREIYEASEKYKKTGNPADFAALDAALENKTGIEMGRVLSEHDADKVRAKYNTILGDPLQEGPVSGVKLEAAALPEGITSKLTKRAYKWFQQELRSDKEISEVVEAASPEDRPFVRSVLEDEGFHRKIQSLQANISTMRSNANLYNINSVADIEAFNVSLNNALDRQVNELFNQHTASLPQDITAPSFVKWNEGAYYKDTIGLPKRFYTVDGNRLYPDKPTMYRNPGARDDPEKAMHLEGSAIRNEWEYETLKPELGFDRDAIMKQNVLDQSLTDGKIDPEHPLFNDPIAAFASPESGLGFRVGQTGLLTQARIDNQLKRLNDLKSSRYHQLVYKQELQRIRKEAIEFHKGSLKDLGVLREGDAAHSPVWTPAEQIRHRNQARTAANTRVKDEISLFEAHMRETRRPVLKPSKTSRRVTEGGKEILAPPTPAPYGKQLKVPVGTKMKVYVSLRNPVDWNDAGRFLLEDILELRKSHPLPTGPIDNLQKELDFMAGVRNLELEEEFEYMSYGFNASPPSSRVDILGRALKNKGSIDNFVREVTGKNVGTYLRELLEDLGYDGIKDKGAKDAVVFDGKALMHAKRPDVSRTVDEVYTNVNNPASVAKVMEAYQNIFGDVLPQSTVRSGSYQRGELYLETLYDDITGEPYTETRDVGYFAPDPEFVNAQRGETAPPRLAPGVISNPENYARVRAYLKKQGFDAIEKEDGSVIPMNPRGTVRSTRTDEQSVSETLRARSTDVQNKLVSDLLGEKVSYKTAEEGYRWRQILLDGARRVKDFIGVNPKTRSDDEWIALAKSVYILKIQTEQARGINPKSSIRALESLTLRMKTPAGRLQEVEKLRGVVAETRKSQKIFRSLASDSDERFIIQAVEKMYRSDWSDVLFEVYVNNILSGMLTHVVNVASGTFNIIMRPTEKMMQSVAATARFDFDQGKADFMEAKSMIMAPIEITKDLIKVIRQKETTDILTTPELQRQTELYQLRNLPAISGEALNKTGTLGSAIDFLGRLWRLPGDVLLKEDKVLKMINYRMSVNQQAMRKSLAEGKSHTDTAALYRLYKINPTEEMRHSAGNDASYYTFTSALTGGFRKAQELRNQTPGARWILPFFQTPTNLVTVGLRHSVVGGIYKDLAPSLKRADSVGDRARARLALGTLIPAAIISEMNEDITGSMDPASPVGRFMASKGILPHSVKILGEQRSYEKLEPVRTVFGLLTEFRDIIDNLDMEDIESEGILSSAAAIVAAPFIKTVTDNYMLPQMQGMFYMLEVIKGGDPESISDDYTGKFFANFASNMVVPNFFNQLKQTGGVFEGVPGLGGLYDPVFRDAENALAAIKARTPGLSAEVPPLVDLWGDPQIMPPGWGPDLISAIPSVPESQDPVDQFIIHLGRNNPDFTFPGRKKEIRGVKLTALQRATFGMIAGKGLPDQGLPPLKDVIAHIIADNYFQSLPIEGQSSIISRHITMRREVVSRYMIATDLELQEKVIDQLREKQAQMTPGAIQ